MKGLILAAGYGKRLLPHSHSTPKHMLPIANKPILQYLVENLVRAGITELGLVVGYKKEQIMDYFGDGKRFGAKIAYIVQELGEGKKFGISHAIGLARGFVGNDQFVALLGDNLFLDEIAGHVGSHLASKASASIGVHEIEGKDAKYFGIAIIQNGSVAKIVEKPDGPPPSTTATVGIYVFSEPARLFKIIDKQKPSVRGELDIADTFQALIDSGVKINPLRVKKRWKDTGRKEDMLEANSFMLEVHGRTAPSAKITNSRLIQPVAIGEDCVITGSTIGPCVSIADGCTISNTEISNSIIMRGCTVEWNDSIENSLIGKCSAIRKRKRENKAYSFSLGDDSVISE